MYWDIAKLAGPLIRPRMYRLREPFAASALNEKVHVDLFFSGDIISSRFMDMYPKYSWLLPVQPKNPQAVWDVFRGRRLGILGPPGSIQMDKGGEWKNEIWADLRSERRNRKRF